MQENVLLDDVVGEGVDEGVDVEEREAEGVGVDEDVVEEDTPDE